MRCATMAMASPSRPTHMQLQSPLFRLPRELRDQIYGHYLLCDTGLEYNFDKNKLTRADGEHIDLSLTYVCRQAAAELHGLALRLNTVTFRTARPSESSNNLGLFCAALRKLHRNKNRLLDEIARSGLTDKSEAFISLVYPQFAPLLRAWRNDGPIMPVFHTNYGHGEPPSVYRDFVNFALHVLKDSPHSSKSSGLPRLPHLEPWQYPDDEVLGEIVSIVFAGDSSVCIMGPDRCLVSAASCAIRFLKSLPTSIRSELRQVDLIEDRESVAYPECHVRGLIPFCQKNEKLRIHRRVDLWWNLLWGFHGGIHMMCSSAVVNTVAEWMVEAMALPLLGMPSRAFKITFEDSESAPDQVCWIFDVLQRHVAWQVALDLSFERQGLPTPTWNDRRLCAGADYDALPQILQNISSHDSFIHYDALLRSTYDPARIIDQFEGESVTEWQEYRRKHYAPSFIGFPKNKPLWCR